MKEATGELNMTVITVVAIAAIAAFFYIFVWPSISISISNNTCESECGENGFTPWTRGDYPLDDTDECQCNP